MAALFAYVEFSALCDCPPKAIEFGEITQNSGHYTVQGHSR